MLKTAQCQSCSRASYPPRVACPFCGATEFVAVADHQGELITQVQQAATGQYLYLIKTQQQVFVLAEATGPAQPGQVVTIQADGKKLWATPFKEINNEEDT